MPPVGLVGHLLPSRMPDKRSDHLQSNRGTSWNWVDVPPNSLRARCGSWEPFVQTAERYPLRLVPERSLTVRDHDDDPNRHEQWAHDQQAAHLSGVDHGNDGDIGVHELSRAGDCRRAF